MTNREKIVRVEEWVKQAVNADPSGHDWWHIERVRKNAISLAVAEKADLFITEMAALLHDMADWKFREEEAAVKEIKEYLINLELNDTIIETIIGIITEVSYKGAEVSDKIKSLEGMCVQDADRLDAIGAIGIGRAFAYGGSKGRPMWDPASKPVRHKSFEEYKKSSSNTINHFYEKLLLLKDRLNTKTARIMAEKRHAFMETFLKQFTEEWLG